MSDMGIYRQLANLEVSEELSVARSNISLAMRSVERRNFLKLTASLRFASPLRSLAEVAPPLGKPVFVGTGADATGTEHHEPRAGTHLDFKVLTKDTLAGFFLLEHRLGKGCYRTGVRCFA